VVPPEQVPLPARWARLPRRLLAAWLALVLAAAALLLLLSLAPATLPGTGR
jgi:hypothetical protein